MFTIEDACLVVIDVQGKLASIVDESEAVIQQISKLVQAMNALEVPVLWLEQNPNSMGNTHPAISQYMEGQPIAKMGFSACQAKEFNDAAKTSGRTQFLITGIETHICVYQTARDLKNRGFEVEVVCDAVSSRTKENKQIGLKKMQSLGILPTSTEMILYELLLTSEHEQFKSILKLIK
jgi:nicotinamidase-related amidase